MLHPVMVSPKQTISIVSTRGDNWPDPWKGLAPGRVSGQRNLLYKSPPWRATIIPQPFLEHLKDLLLETEVWF